MTDNPLPGIFHIEGNAYPARFDPATWTVSLPYEPEDEVFVTDPSRDYPARFESGRTGGGSITGFARCIRIDRDGHFLLRLKSLLEQEDDQGLPG